ncbi:hypothetical protein [Neorhizobium alkalisoli]|jgi:hypothetical protein|nr:hypothetical protein [Neorhizobium alkalisoli]
MQNTPKPGQQNDQKSNQQDDQTKRPMESRPDDKKGGAGSDDSRKGSDRT